MTGWLAPTARATTWAPLAGVAICLVGTALVTGYANQVSVGLLGTTAAALAAATVAGLHDPAAALLSAVPTTAARRRAHRLGLLLPAAAVVWLAYLAAGHWWAAAEGWPLGPVVALTATGLAAAVWAPERIRVEAGVAAPLLWYALVWAGGSLDQEYAEVVLAWQHHPWAVAAAAGTAYLIGRNR